MEEKKRNIEEIEEQEIELEEDKKEERIGIAYIYS